MFCTQCGNRHEAPVGKFCSSCGAAVELPEAAPIATNAGVASAVPASAAPPLVASPTPPAPAHTSEPVLPPHQASTPAPAITNTIIVLTPKSVGLAIFLALFFGPLGLLYSSVKAAIIMFLIALVVVPLTIGIGIFLINPICAFLAYSAASANNASLGAVATRVQ